MTEETPAHVQQAVEALALTQRVGAPVALAAQRAGRRHLVAIGAATAVAILGTGFITHQGDRLGSLPRALMVGLLWGVAFGIAAVALNAQAVRPRPVRRRAVRIVVVSALVVGATMAVGEDHVLAYPIGAAATIAVWLVGSVWVRR